MIENSLSLTYTRNILEAFPDEQSTKAALGEIDAAEAVIKAARDIYFAMGGKGEIRAWNDLERSLFSYGMWHGIHHIEMVEE
jgi:hypothetical protein